MKNEETIVKCGICGAIVDMQVMYGQFMDCPYCRISESVKFVSVQPDSGKPSEYEILDTVIEFCSLHRESACQRHGGVAP